MTKDHEIVEKATLVVQCIEDANSHTFEFVCEADREEAISIVADAIAGGVWHWRYERACAGLVPGLVICRLNDMGGGYERERISEDQDWPRAGY